MFNYIIIIKKTFFLEEKTNTKLKRLVVSLEGAERSEHKK